MPHWRGPKLRGGHETHIDMITDIASILKEKPLWRLVNGVSLGVITSGKGAGNGYRSVKLIDMQGGIFLKVRQTLAVQEMRLWTDNPRELKLLLSRRLRDNRIPISFRKEV